MGSCAVFFSAWVPGFLDGPAAKAAGTIPFPSKYLEWFVRLWLVFLAFWFLVSGGFCTGCFNFWSFMSVRQLKQPVLLLFQANI